VEIQNNNTGADRVLQAAAWTYWAPHAAIGVVIVGMLGLGAFMVLVQIALIILRRLGA